MARSPACRVLEDFGDVLQTHTRTDRQLTRVSARTHAHARTTDRGQGKQQRASDCGAATVLRSGGARLNCLRVLTPAHPLLVAHVAYTDVRQAHSLLCLNNRLLAGLIFDTILSQQIILNTLTTERALRSKPLVYLCLNLREQEFYLRQN